jgi:hypothetical protein
MASSAVLPQDWDDPYALAPKPLGPGVPPATMASDGSSYGFVPGSDPWQGGDWWRTPLPNGAFNPQLTSSGATGTGDTAQPQASTSSNGPSAAAGQLLAPKSPPPPIPPGLQTSAPATQPQGPPSMPQKSAPPGMTPEGLIQRGPDQAAAAQQQALDNMTPLQRSVQQAEERVASIQPELKSNWGQKLAMAVLSMTKLSPAAMQIVHPTYTMQMAQRESALKDLDALTKAEETEQRGQWYTAQAQGARQKPIVMKDGSIYDVRTGQIVQAAPTPLERKQQALELGLDEDAANTYALGIKPGDIEKSQTVPWSGLSPQLQSLYAADNKGNARVPTSILEKTVQAATAATTPMTPERIGQLNQLLGARVKQVNPGSPIPQYMQLPQNATLEDYQNVEKAVSGLENQAGTMANQQANQQLRQQTFALAQMEAQRRSDELKLKQDQTDRTLAEKLYSPVQDSAERFNVMTKSLEDAITNHDQQAMVNLLYNHMGMTMGLQKGARMNQAAISEAIKSRPWLQGMGSKFDNQGYLSGVTLTPQQMMQMVSLAQNRFGQDTSKARSSAQFMGVKNDGPSRVPADSTKRYYMHVAGNDPAKATQMMLQDGWAPQ